MKKTIYIVWSSAENADNCGCWFNDMEIKVFNTKKDAVKYMDSIPYDEGCYCDMVKKTIKV